MITYVTFAPAV